jgi:hypothetical protein
MDINVITLLERRCTNFPKILKPPQNLGARSMTRKKYHTEHPQILGATAQNIVAMANCHLY